MAGWTNEYDLVTQWANKSLCSGGPNLNQYPLTSASIFGNMTSCLGVGPLPMKNAGSARPWDSGGRRNIMIVNFIHHSRPDSSELGFCPNVHWADLNMVHNLWTSGKSLNTLLL
jgi:hypothetical protein